MKIDDDIALQLYDHSTTAAHAFDKVSNAEEIKAFSILDVPCEITFGFSTRLKSPSPNVEACVWIFNARLAEFYGSYYLPVANRGNAVAALNDAICKAIDQAKDNQAFKAALARKQTNAGS